MNERIKLAEAMGWIAVTENRWVHEECKGKGPLDWDDRDAKYDFELPDPFTDANDDYAVLERMRSDYRWQKFKNELVNARKIDAKWHGSQYTWNYQIGDYARAALAVIGRR